MKEPLPFTWERTEKAYPVPSRHGDVPGFEINSEVETSSTEDEPGDSAEFPPSEKELFHGSQFGVSAPVLLCRLGAKVPLKRIG